MRREVKAYFSSPIGYVYLAVFYVFAGFYFFATTLSANTTDMSYMFESLFLVVMFLIPILTMRLFSEDLKHRTDQALLTAPINLTSLVMGKYLAAVFVYFLGMAITIIFAVVVAVFSAPNWMLVWGNFLAMLLLGMSLISIGMFISSMTENQVISAIGAFAVVLALLLLDGLASLAQSPWAIAVFDGVSFMKRYNSFTTGIFDLSGAVFFLSVSAVFVFLTVRILDRRRWA
jgi:ABC-2 type transport system permease protein